MTARKFAPITASILARKGEAKPWQDPEKETMHWDDARVEPEVSFRPQVIERSVKPESADPIPTKSSELRKKYSVRMSFREYEQLGILAVKRDCSRQQLLREALAELFTALARDYRSECRCLKQYNGDRGEVAASSYPFSDQ